MQKTMDQDQRPIRVGISACLLGQKVRFDGGHKHDRFLGDTLGQYVEWVPVCPEVEVGLPIPRPTLRLTRHGDEVRMVIPKQQRDITRQMRAYARRRAARLEDQDLCGFVLKKDSPSCGMERVKVYPEQEGPAARVGRGLFAEALLDRLPNLPVEEEGRLHDPRLRENWITRLFAYHRLRDLWAGRWKVGDLVAFHTAQKFLLLAHCPTAYRELGRLVADARQVSRQELRESYEARLMAGLKRLATPAKNANVLQHVMGFFKRDLDAASRRELLGHIEDYRRGLVPLIVPLTLVAHYVRLLDEPYLRGQIYLNPHPKELALRNHV